MRILSSIAVLSLLLGPGTAQAKDKPPIVLAKTSKWEMNYDQDSCHLISKFGEGDQSVMVRMTRFQPGDWFDLTLYGKQFKASATTVSTEIGFVPTFGFAKREGLMGSVGSARNEKLPLLILTGQRLDGWSNPGEAIPPVTTQEQEAAVSAIALRLRGKHFRLETGSLGKPMEAMRTCLGNLIEHWGFDPAVQARLSRPVQPVGSPGDWLGSNDYPTKLLAEGIMGLVQFRLDIDEVGKVTGCRVLYRTNPDDFADLSCKLLTKRAKFTAALDEQGKPVRTFYIGKIRWMVPAY